MTIEKQIAELEAEEIAIKEKLYRLRKQVPRFEVQDYLLHDREGRPIHLHELFDKHQQLILVHNMGKSCPYCTLWADGLNGLTAHLENRAAFVVATPDPHPIMNDFAKSRNWTFKMVSTAPSTLKKDLGFELEDGSYYPGVSTMQMDEHGKIWHIAKAYFGPGDDFCALWYLFDLLPVEDANWTPKFQY